MKLNKDSPSDILPASQFVIRRKTVAVHINHLKKKFKKHLLLCILDQRMNALQLWFLFHKAMKKSVKSGRMVLVILPFP